MGGEDLISRVLMLEAVSEVSQYELDMDKLIVYTKHVTLPDNEDEWKCIKGIETIQNSFREVHIPPFTKIREIGSIASGQAR